MYPHKTIYQKGWPKSGEIKLSPSSLVKIGFHLARIVGAGLVAFAITGIIFSLWPVAKEEFLYQFGSDRQAAVSGFGEILSKSYASDIGLDPYFSIYIPKINAKANIIPNVDPGSPRDYLKALSHGVAHAKGTNYPGQGKLIYLFSHSTDSPLNFARYNAVFYLLGKLEVGDRIEIFFMNQRHEYAVSQKFTTTANDTSWITDDGSGEKLVLQTCNPPGTSWNRLLIVAKPI